MNIMGIKASFFIVLMIVFLILAFVAKDLANGQLFASLGIISGAFANNSLSGISETEK